MMDGYSVTDAASVLGVPEGRVWELLARGVLAGTPEGDSMRVFLKADAPTAPRPAPPEALPRGNGNGGSHAAEASAFRELLTEFRNLTERYGQALLALGEARGEVAGLRSRVELLEARVDLRVPARFDAEPIAWGAAAPSPPAPAISEVEPRSPAEVEAELPASAPVERPVRPRKARAQRAAVAGFAEALARAQDPGVADVAADPSAATPTGPAPEEVAAELAAELAVEEMTGEALPAEAPVDEPAIEATVPAAEPTYRAAELEPEPDWFADGDFSWLDAAELEARGRPEATGAGATGAEVAALPIEEAPAAATEPAESLEPGLATEPPVVPEPIAASVPEPIAEPEPEPLPAVALPILPEPVVIVAPVEPVAIADSGEEALMWIGAPHEPAAEIEITAASAPAAPPEPSAWPATDRATQAPQPLPPPLAMTEEELAQLARDEGWDEAEVAAIRAIISTPTAGNVVLPGSAELDEAMTALQAVPVTPRREDAAAHQWAKPATRDEERPVRDDWAFEVEAPAAPAATSRGLVAARREASEQDWLRRRRGPAAEAYRRIRRIFTG